MNCCCGSGKKYSDCCQRYHLKHCYPDNCLALMRSRFSAYALGGLGQYLFETWCPTVQVNLSVSELQQSDIDWTSLTILDHGHDWVEFVAWYRNADGFDYLHERSKFIQIDGRWLYQTGQIFEHMIKLGRNDACPCGSGKKFKKCCA